MKISELKLTVVSIDCPNHVMVLFVLGCCRYKEVYLIPYIGLRHKLYDFKDLRLSFLCLQGRIIRLCL